MAEYDRPLRRVRAAHLLRSRHRGRGGDPRAADPSCGALLDRLESAEGRHRAARAVRAHPAGGGRLRAGRSGTAAAASWRPAGSATSNLLKGALLDDHYIEHEVRLAYIAATAANGKLPTPEPLRDPLKHLKARVEDAETAHRTGHVVDRGGNTVPALNYADIGRIRLDHLHACLDGIRAEEVPGDLAEIATGRGGGAIFMRGTSTRSDIPERRVWVADPFRTHTPDVAPTHRGRDARPAARRQPGAAGLRALRPARRPGPLPPGRAGRASSPRPRPSSPSRSCASVRVRATRSATCSPRGSRRWSPVAS